MSYFYFRQKMRFWLQNSPPPVQFLLLPTHSNCGACCHGNGSFIPCYESISILKKLWRKYQLLTDPPPPLTIHQGKERNTKNTTSSQSLKKKKKGLTREKTQPAKAWTFLCFSVLLLYTRSTKKESGGVRDGGIKRTLQIYMVAGTIRLSTRQHE